MDMLNITDWLFQSLIYLFIHSFIRSFVRSFVHSFVRSFIQSCPRDRLLRNDRPN